MTDFPYIQATGKLKNFFEKIQHVGKPETVEKKWLSSIGFSATNDMRIIPVLKFIGFVDQSGVPTDRWMSYRDKSRSRKVMAEGVLSGYSGLFEVYPDAQHRSDDELKAYFSTRTTAGSQVISKTVATLKALCELSDLEDDSLGSSLVDQPKKMTQSNLDEQTRIRKVLDTGVTININIQLTLPETTDESVYDKLFAAMKKHLLV